MNNSVRGAGAPLFIAVPPQQATTHNPGHRRLLDSRLHRSTVPEVRTLVIATLADFSKELDEGGGLSNRWDVLPFAAAFAALFVVTFVLASRRLQTV